MYKYRLQIKLGFNKKTNKQMLQGLPSNGRYMVAYPMFVAQQKMPVSQYEKIVNKMQDTLYYDIRCLLQTYFLFIYCNFTIYSRYLKRVISKRDECVFLKQELI
jgi:hypothetical protein